MRRVAVLVVALLTVWLAAAPTVGAGPLTDQFKGDLERVLTAIEETGKNGLDAARRQEAIRSMAEPVFDWREMASRSLGVHWQPRSEAERAEFVDLFRDLIQRSYITQVERYSGEPVRFTGEKVDGNLGLVSTRILTRRGQEVPIDYRLVNRDGRWRVYDVQVEGVSLIGNFRTQFDKVIRTSGYGELVQRLKAKGSAAQL
ncbi:MAG TPA: ABC transporter substrate-binding protein [Pseudomonadales bacterium]|nr:ABC transporter substrate-binding protein [Pseudomonadales bacterium]